jgi:hypothetical protein
MAKKSKSRNKGKTLAESLAKPILGLDGHFNRVDLAFGRDRRKSSAFSK